MHRGAVTERGYRKRVAVVFGVCGLLSGLTYVTIQLQHRGTFFRDSREGGGSQVLWWAGIIFFLGLAAGTWICHQLNWIQIRASVFRLTGSAITIILSAFFAVNSGVLFGFAMAALTAQPSNPAGMIPPAHPEIFYGFPLVMGLVFGLTVEALLVSLALYILTETVNYRAFGALVIGSLVLVLLAVLLNPKVLDMLRLSSAGKNTDDIFGLTFATLYLAGCTYYAWCAGYWMTKNRVPQDFPFDRA
jgi:hypothetical protein